VNGSTGPGGRLFAATAYGTYSIPEAWAERRIPTLDRLAEFLAGVSMATGHRATRHVLRLLQQMCAADPTERARLRETFPREDAALYHWQGLSPLLPVEDAHGPTMRQLLDSLNDSSGGASV